MKYRMMCLQKILFELNRKTAIKTSKISNEHQFLDPESSSLYYTRDQLDLPNMDIYNLNNFSIMLTESILVKDWLTLSSSRKIKLLQSVLSKIKFNYKNNHR